jgi:OOP family OmpA-OmpF porin
MKKIGMLMFIVMMMAVVTAVQAEVRAGGLPTITTDDRIKDCNCRLFPQCCQQPIVEPAPVPEPVPEPAPVVVPPPPPPPPPAPKPVIMEKGRQTLNVEFDFDKATIKKGYDQDIDNLVQVMKDYPDLKVVIEGHTDSVGTAAYNKKLSQQRAEAVKKYMAEKGIDANRLKAQGFGEEKPIASNETKEGRQQNRRVEAAVDYMIEK